MGPPFGLYPLKIWDSSRAKRIKSNLCSHLKEDDEVQTWLVTVNLNESVQCPEKLYPIFLLFTVFCIFLQWHKKITILVFPSDKNCKSPFTAKKHCLSRQDTYLSQKTNEKSVFTTFKSNHVSFLITYAMKIKKKVNFLFYLWRWIYGLPLVNSK